MQNVFIIGDLHLKCTSPISRKDCYPTVILNKLEYLSSIAHNYNCSTFILLGDVFDSPATSLPYLAQVIATFKKISDKGIDVYTIVGNHDIKNNRMDSLQSTALGILISTGCLKLAPRELEISNTLFRCFNYPEELTPRQNNDKYEVCIAHRYYNFGLSWDSLKEDDIKALDYSDMVLGHLHLPCDTEIVGNTTLYRPGSLSRNTSELYNKLRTPRVLLYNCINHKTMYIDVVCESADKVFVEQIDNSTESFSMRDLIKFITTSYSSSDMNIREYFCSIEIPNECREKIAKYLDAIGA